MRKLLKLAESNSKKSLRGGLFSDCVWDIPYPHQGDISKDLLARILRQAEIDKDEWENLQ